MIEIKRYIFNTEYFNNINTADKAYWLGFIWSDGYIAKRDRGKHFEYNLKIALKESDYHHLEKFVKNINGNYPIHFYDSTGFKNQETKSRECRIFITNKKVVSYLYEDLGIIPRRTNPNKLIEIIPENLHKYFILGVFDADGSFSAYQKDTYGEKLNVAFGGSIQLLNFIQRHLIEKEIIKDSCRKLTQRHENKDGDWKTLSFSGKVQGMKILNYLYNSPIYLDRKYQKYLDLPYHNN